MLMLGARYYVPALGRFLTQDPIGHMGGLNLNAYCDNSPLLNADSDGRQKRKNRVAIIAGDRSGWAGVMHLPMAAAIAQMRNEGYFVGK